MAIRTRGIDQVLDDVQGSNPDFLFPGLERFQQELNDMVSERTRYRHTSYCNDSMT